MGGLLIRSAARINGESLDDLVCEFSDVGIRIQAHRNVTRRGWDHELEEVPVPDEQIVKPATIDVAPPAGQRQECGIDEEFFVTVRLERRAIGTGFTLPDLWFSATVGHGDVTDGATQIGQSLGYHMHDRIMPRRARLRAGMAPVNRQGITSAEAFMVQGGDYIDTTRDEIVAEVGSFDRYFDEALGLDASVIGELRNTLLE